MNPAPAATTVLQHVLDATAGLEVADALVIESLAYSALLSGRAFGSWRESRPRRTIAAATQDPVLVRREGNGLHVTLNRPERRNAFSSAVREGLLDALAVASADPAVRRVVLDGAGPAFCSGGDLDEFGTAADPVAAHLLRVERSAGLAVHRLRDRVFPVLHGGCVGAGLEVPAFADHVVARADATFRLPELSMGLIPGAGGTVSIPRRIGRERFTRLATTGETIDAATALSWGLVDEVVP
ncbi:enoyl-CoA hydratase/isomerase family protein [Nocardioides mangrovicus]|nr:enoyl-CoA hydratase/isomerase family protein [Nocardioides mangrovicus]